jgi:hypothetical protein
MWLLGFAMAWRVWIVGAPIVSSITFKIEVILSSQKNTAIQPSRRKVSLQE